ncbi:MAG: hypothetical protein JSV80_15490 [Acidobacteriota bacterium]|nr:MAG: hypothetical protein JSV80_15490 [Acidobacteriota bacterium]
MVSFETRALTYAVDRTAQLTIELRPPRSGVAVTLTALNTGPIWIQTLDPALPDPVTSSDRIELRATSPFWTYHAAARAGLGAGLGLVVGVDNITDEVQPDIDDPSVDHPWGPQPGRYVYARLTYAFDRL